LRFECQADIVGYDIKNVFLSRVFMNNTKQHSHLLSALKIITQSLLLSWFYAACSQAIVPLPLNMVPLSLQPLPLLVVTFLFGWSAVSAYMFYLAQGAMGLPFFSGLRGGLLHLLGPTGGYLFGFWLAMIFIAATRNYKRQSSMILLGKLLIACVIYFICGLAQLSWFVAPENLFAAGLYPFIVGDFFIKMPSAFLMVRYFKR
jgi:biotin transport system substrate-specific component